MNLLHFGVLAGALLSTPSFAASDPWVFVDEAKYVSGSLTIADFPAATVLRSKKEIHFAARSFVADIELGNADVQCEIDRPSTSLPALTLPTGTPLTVSSARFTPAAWGPTGWVPATALMTFSDSSSWVSCIWPKLTRPTDSVSLPDWVELLDAAFRTPLAFSIVRPAGPPVDPAKAGCPARQRMVASRDFEFSRSATPAKPITLPGGGDVFLVTDGENYLRALLENCQLEVLPSPDPIVPRVIPKGTVLSFQGFGTGTILNDYAVTLPIILVPGGDPKGTPKVRLVCTAKRAETYVPAGGPWYVSPRNWTLTAFNHIKCKDLRMDRLAPAEFPGVDL